MRLPTRFLMVAPLSMACLLFAACGGGAQGASGGKVAGGSQTKSGESLKGVKVAYASDLDTGDVADQFGLRKMDASVTTLNEDSSVVAGLVRGDFAFGQLEVPAAIKAAQQGAPLKLLYIKANQPEYVMVSQEGLKSFASLAGKTVAFHSQGDVTDVMLHLLIREHGGKDLVNAVHWAAVPESPNRAKALVGGRIDATVLEYTDLLAIQKQGHYNRLATWDDIKDPDAAAVKEESWVTTQDYFENHRQACLTFARDMQAGYAEFYEKKAAWIKLVHETLPKLDATDSDLAKLHDYYQEIKRYPTGKTPAASPEEWRHMDAFFEDIGAYQGGTPKTLVAFDLMNEVAH